jgi:hypothetical protein
MNSDDDKELKQLWTKYSEAASRSRLNQKEIAAMVEQVIEHPLRKMRKGLFWDISCTVLVCSWFTYIGLQHLGDWYFILPLVLLMAGCIYALCARVRALRRLQRVSKQPPEMILQTLRKSIEKMGSQNINNIGALLVVVFCLCAAIVSKIYFSQNPYFTALRAFSPTVRFCVVFALASGAASAYVYARWYRQHFYREPMERMQKAIREIEQEN